jgi:hypothetical protein
MGGDDAYLRPFSAPFDRWLTRLHFCGKMDIEAYYTSSGLKQCCHCRTEYQIDFKHYPGHGMVVFCTQWKGLGAGPDHRTWKAHSTRQFLFSQSVSLNVGEVSSAFQKGEQFHFDSLMQTGITNWLVNGAAGPLVANVAHNLDPMFWGTGRGRL